MVKIESADVSIFSLDTRQRTQSCFLYVSIYYMSDFKKYTLLVLLAEPGIYPILCYGLNWCLINYYGKDGYVFFK